MSFFSAAPPSSWASTVSISTRATQAPGLAVRMAAHVTSEPRPTPRPASSVRARSATRPRCARSPWPTRATPALAWTVALARWKVWTVTRARVRLALLVSSGYLYVCADLLKLSHPLSWHYNVSNATRRVPEVGRALNWCLSGSKIADHVAMGRNTSKFQSVTVESEICKR